MSQSPDTMRDQLADPGLFLAQCLVNGEWVGAVSGATTATWNPATGSELAKVPALSQEEARQSIDAAHRALQGWAKRTPWERSAVLKEWYKLIVANKEDLAKILTAEQGKPLAEARGELQIAADYVNWFAEEAVRTSGETIPTPWAGARLSTIKQPVGVCAAITPWNFPASMVTRKVAPALAAGCSIILKPAERTPHSAFALAELARRAGVPKGVFNVVTGPARVIGAELCSNEKVRKLSFTGSTEVGRLLMAQVASTVKRVSLELGGNAPFIVFDDADVDAAVEGAIVSKYRNAGQTCVCANRIFVQSGIYETFSSRLADRVKELRVGAGTEEGVQIGPLIDDEALAKVERHVSDAVSKGAKVLVGGKRHSRGGTFFEPTVLGEATQTMQIFSEETFGPVAPLIKFTTEEEAIELANDSEFGLASYFYSRDIGRVHRVSEALAAGMVGVNTGMITTVAAPFGGVNQSGIGREGGTYGIDEYLDVKYVCLSGI